MKKIIILLSLLAFFYLSYGQKIGYCQVDQVVAIMPEAEKAKAQFEKEVNDYQSALEEM